MDLNEVDQVLLHFVTNPFNFLEDEFELSILRKFNYWCCCVLHRTEADNGIDLFPQDFFFISHKNELAGGFQKIICFNEEQKIFG